MSDNHLVSKTYLKWFQDNASKKPFCSFHQLVKGKLQWTDPKPTDRQRICYEKDRFFQKTEEEFQKLFESSWDHVIEHLNQFDFSKLENRHNKKNRILNGYQVGLILNFIFTHYKRAKHIKNANKKNPLVLNELNKYSLKLGRELSKDEIDEFHKKVDNNFVIAPQSSIKFFKKNPWLLMVNQTETPFITSSTPVLWLNEMRNIGIFTPLSPQFAIFIPLGWSNEKNGIVIEYINEANTKKFNSLLKEATIRNLEETPILISNKKSELTSLISEINNDCL